MNFSTLSDVQSCYHWGFIILPRFMNFRLISFPRFMNFRLKWVYRASAFTAFYECTPIFQHAGHCHTSFSYVTQIKIQVFHITVSSPTCIWTHTLPIIQLFRQTVFEHRCYLDITLIHLTISLHTSIWTHLKSEYASPRLKWVHLLEHTQNLNMRLGA